ncbi:MAG: BatA domain-containing protein [Planctomycetia bacterium]
MTFLEPWLLVALPLVSLPVVIHLIHQRRFQSVDWAAMMFLRSARLISRGFSRLRQWLIMLLRVAAVAAVILAMSRPLSQGWLASVGGDTAAAIVLLDRSPSMAQAAGVAGESKLDTARRELATALETLGTRRIVLVDSGTRVPQEVDGPRGLRALPETEPCAAPADLPLLLEAACARLRSREEAIGAVWICSDQRANDWQPGDPAWAAIRESLAGLPDPVRLTLLAYPESAVENRSVRVDRAVVERRGQAWELLLDVSIRQAGGEGGARVPLQIELALARSTVDVELTGPVTILSRHAIPLDAAALADAGRPADLPADRPAGEREAGGFHGWGRVSIPADENPADDEFFFAFSTAPVRRCLVAGDDPQAVQALALVAGIAPTRQDRATVETVDAAAIADTTLGDVACLLWQAPLPEGRTAEAVTRYLARGGQVIFFPPREPTAAAFEGLAWTQWTDHAPPVSPTSWRADEGLLASTLSGASLPVGGLEIRRTCGLSGVARHGTPLAVLADGEPLVVRATRETEGLYFCTTTPSPGDSDLAASGVTLYVLVQRAIDAGSGPLAAARQVDAGAAAEAVLGASPGSDSGAGTGAGDGGTADSEPASSPPASVEWRRIAGPPAVSTEAAFHAGVYAHDSRLVAVNRPAAEDAAEILADPVVDRLFDGLRLSRHRRQAGGLGGIVEEVWRLVLVAVLAALVVEGLLCLPRRTAAAPQPAAWRREAAA